MSALPDAEGNSNYHKEFKCQYNSPPQHTLEEQGARTKGFSASPNLFLKKKVLSRRAAEEVGVVVGVVVVVVLVVRVVCESIKGL